MTSQLPVRSGEPSGKPFKRMVWIAAVVLFVFAAGQTFNQTFSTVSHAQGPTVWDGVYTDVQADRGKTLYADTCAPCHGDKAEGTGMAPGLSGADFAADFPAMSDLFSRISMSMPANDPGKLKPAQVADVIAFLAKSNMWPAGQTELPSDEAALKGIKIVKK
jgi:mono/diheme cytochrome c family protein